MEGCFFLTRHHDGDFDVLVGGPLLKKNENYAKELEQVKKVVKAIDDPVAALKAKDVDDRFQAAQVILQRYQTLRGQKPGDTPAREPIPEEETKLIVALLKELPWAQGRRSRPAGEQPPSRGALWYQINPAELRVQAADRPGRKAGRPAGRLQQDHGRGDGEVLKENGGQDQDQAVRVEVTGPPHPL